VCVAVKQQDLLECGVDIEDGVAFSGCALVVQMFNATTNFEAKKMSWSVCLIRFSWRHHPQLSFIISG
jgi:hypothetical protein